MTFLTVGVSFLNLGGWHTIVGLFIAVCKATLAVLVFMHLWSSNRLTGVIALTAIYFLGLPLGLTLTDYWSRWKMLF